MPGVTELESAVLERLLEGAGPALEQLRSQLGSLEVRSREWTGVGFVTEVEVPSSHPEASEVPLKGTVGDLVADIPGLAGGVGFLVYVASGRLTALEGHTYGGPWPESVPVSTLRYVDPRERDLSGLAVDPGPSASCGG